MKVRGEWLSSPHADVFFKDEVCDWGGCNKSARWDIVAHVAVPGRQSGSFCRPHARAVIRYLDRIVERRRPRTSQEPTP